MSQSLESIPACAQSCLSSFIANDYPTSLCPSQQDLACLCSKHGLAGFTIGEGAYSCVTAGCSGQIVEDSKPVYDICAGRMNAVTPTHSTLTVTQSTATLSPLSTISLPISTSASGMTSIQDVSPSISTNPTSLSLPPSIRAPNSTISVSGLLTASGTAPPPLTTIIPFETAPRVMAANTIPTPLTIASSTPSLAGIVTLLSASSSTPISPSSPTGTHLVSAVPSTTTLPVRSGRLSSGQTIGIVAAATITFISLVAGLIFLAIKYRRKKERRHSAASSFDFKSAEPKPWYPPPPIFGVRDPRGGLGGVGVAPLPLPLPSQPNRVGKVFSWMRASTRPEDIGVALSPETQHREFQLGSSVRTLSQLLPERPEKARTTQKVPPAPPHISHMSASTVFEEDLEAFNAKTNFLVPPSPSHRSSSNNPDSPFRYAAFLSGAPKRFRPPGLIPAPYSPAHTEPQIQRKPLPPLKPLPSTIESAKTAQPGNDTANLPVSMAADTARTSTSEAPLTGTTRSSDIPTYYTRPRNDAPHLPAPCHPAPLFNCSTPLRRHLTPGRSSRTSYGSETSFETVDSDDITPPTDVESNPMSPIPPSAARSPITGLKYPKIPRPSSQAVPRSPISHLPASLLAKRRGRAKAQDLESGFWITDSSVAGFKAQQMHDGWWGNKGTVYRGHRKSRSESAMRLLSHDDYGGQVGAGARKMVRTPQSGNPLGSHPPFTPLR